MVVYCTDIKLIIIKFCRNDGRGQRLAKGLGIAEVYTLIDSLGNGY